MKNIDRLRGFYPKLDEVLDWFPHDRIKSLVFTRREDVHSVSFISHFAKGTQDEENFERICQFNFPTSWYETPNGWVSYVAADLESVGTGKLRVYKNQPDRNPHDPSVEWTENVAYYIDSETGKILGTKHYHRNEIDLCYYIDYYDEDDNLISARQKEVLGTKEDWGGPEELYNIVNEENFGYQFGIKENKDQAYFVLYVS